MTTTGPEPDRVAAGIVITVLTSLVLSLGDAFIKSFSQDLVLWQIFVCRSLIVLPVLIAFMGWRGRLALLLPRSLFWTTLRSFMLVIMWVAYYVALPHVSLGVAAATYYTLPLFIMLFARMFLGDRISLLGWLAVLMGFAGIILILDPTIEGVNPYALLPLISAVLFALAMIITRSKCRSEDAFALSFHLNVMFILVGLLASTWRLLALGPAHGADGFVWGPWPAMRVQEWTVMAMLAAAIIIGSVGTAVAFQIAPPAILAPFSFAYVAFAALWGVLLLHEHPSFKAMAGMLLIILSGLGAMRAPTGKAEQVAGGPR